MVVSLLLLVFLTIIGITATSNSRMESTMTRNSQVYKRDFYVADSGWRIAAMNLQSFGLAPPNYPQAGGAGSEAINGINYDYQSILWGMGRAVGSSRVIHCADANFRVRSRAYDSDGVTATQEVNTVLIKLTCSSYNN